MTYSSSLPITWAPRKRNPHRSRVQQEVENLYDVAKKLHLDDDLLFQMDDCKEHHVQANSSWELSKLCSSIWTQYFGQAVQFLFSTGGGATVDLMQNKKISFGTLTYGHTSARIVVWLKE
jgi:23S rRNA pseudoU1915 N3-methylase RlmH